MCEENSLQFFVRGRVWIDAGDIPFLGQGKVQLLEKIKELGSLRKAAAEMKMSYQKAWFSIDEMNKAASKPLVILKHGGKGGGIAEVTDIGDKAIQIFKQLQNDFDDFVREKSHNIELL